MKVEPGHADVGNAESGDDEPEGASAQRFTPAPSDVLSRALGRALRLV